MDLERLGALALAERFLAAYTEYSGDTAPVSLRHHYVAYRAFVRVKVACLRAGQGDPAAGFEARYLAEMGLRHLRASAVILVLLGGLPGTGKSALAGAVADQLGFTVLSSDRVRKELTGLPAEASVPAPFGTGIYSAEWTERAYAELLRRATTLLTHGESVIIDASFSSAKHRAAAAATAADTSADLVQLHCTASPELAARRMSTRASTISDADPQIAQAMAAAADPWPEAQAINTDSGGISGELGDLIQQALRAIRPSSTEQLWHPTRPYMSPE